MKQFKRTRHPAKSDAVTIIRHIKSHYSDAVRLIKQHDQYVSYGNDALLIGFIEDIGVLPCIGQGWKCAVPARELETTIQHLTDEGYSVAVCE